MAAKVAVLDMQPIDPPTGGGRLRLLGLYHGLGAQLPVRYVGSYDWPGPGRRQQMMSETLEELVVPLSDAHFAAANARAKACSGRGVIDTTFHQLARLSPDYVAAARQAAEAADVVVFSHPWIHPLVQDLLDPERQLIVYDAHNMEGLLRLELLDDGGAGTEVAREVARAEFLLCHAAHLVIACSHEDRDAFVRLYHIAPERTRVVPNGAFTGATSPSSPEEKSAARQAAGLGAGPVALFIGSNYGPNVEAAQYIARVLAPALPTVTFVVAGGVGEGLTPKPANVLRTGQISETEKRRLLQATDIAINPMFAGSGTNIKMFDFMSAGLPIVSTPIGARGIKADSAVLRLTGTRFRETIVGVLSDRAAAEAMGRAARRRVEESYSWERISADLGVLLGRRFARLQHQAPAFSVIVPTFERPALLTRLVEQLAAQSWRDFELIVIDQSGDPWPDRDRDFGLDLLYVHTDLRGAVFARNRGADLARGDVLAFIDDDCVPTNSWLAAARARFAADNLAGLEGLITSSHGDDPDWRPVTNDGFEGVGFMTANLFVRADVFQRIDGFDTAFDNPHFREDTDLGWRVQLQGKLPFSREAHVFHPPQSRSVERESLAVRSAFFENDALLLRKHPERYVELLRRECQWTHNPHFWSYFTQGLLRYGVDPPAGVRSLMPRGELARLAAAARSPRD